MSFQICCIGHITIDHVITPAASVTMPGGTAFYFSEAISQLPVSYGLVTAIAATELPVARALEAKGISVLVLPSVYSVCFENRYGADTDQRTQRVLQKADPFGPNGFVGVEAELFHLGPLLADDFSVELIRQLRGKGMLSLDVQGFLRTVKNRQVQAVDWPEKHEVLPLVHFLKANEEEMEVLTRTNDVAKGARQLFNWGAREVIVTLGSKGSVVVNEKGLTRIPAYRPVQLTDATGCGDTYMAGYLFRRCRGAGEAAAGKFAAAMATLKLAVSGPFNGTESDADAVVAARNIC